MKKRILVILVLFLNLLRLQVSANPGAMTQALLGAGAACYELDATWAPQWASMKGLWHLNESSGALVDSSPSGVNGSAVGTVTYGAGARLGKGVELNGSASYISFGNISNYDFNLNFTVSGWFKLNSLPSGSDVCPRRAPIFANWEWGYVSEVSTAGKVRFGRYYSSGQIYDSYSQTVIVPGKWYHLALVQTSDTLKLFLNGVLEASVPATNNTYYVASDFPALGSTRCGGTSYYLNGALDEFAIWSTALSDTEVKRIYDQQSCGQN